MPNSIISEGSTTNEAIENGLKILKTTKSKVNIRVLENEDKRSFFSILEKRKVKVELTLKEDAVATETVSSKPKELRTYSQQELENAEKNVKIFLDELLGKMGNDSTYQINKDEHGLNVSIDGSCANYLIGYRGETLYAVQNILVSVASRGLESRVRVILDIAGYKAKREKTLEDLAEKVAKTVIRTGKSVTLEPMKAYERKIIHSKLQDYKKISTNSIGEEPRRRIVISLIK